MFHFPDISEHRLPTPRRFLLLAFSVALIASVLTSVTTPSTAEALGSNVQFQPVAPYRSNDTRANSGGRLAAKQIRRFTVSGLPAATVEVVANVTAIDTGGPGFLTVWDCNRSRPTTSNVNYGPNQVIPNQVTVPVSGNGICIYTHAAADIAIDVSGYWISGAGTAPLTVGPSRLSDSRDTGTHGAGETRQFVVGTDRVPADATAVNLNATALNADRSGFVTIYPCDSAMPVVSNLNPTPGVTKPNQVTVKLGADRSICVYTSSSVDLVIDVTGAFGPGQAMTLRSQAPMRVIDSRDGTGGLSSRLSGQQQILPQSAATLVANLTAVDSIGDGWLSVFPCNTGFTGTSNINYVHGAASSNAVIVDASNGGVCLRTSNPTNVVFDVFSSVVNPSAPPPTECIQLGLNDPNAWRASLGRPSLAFDQGLYVGACAYAKEMLRTGDFKHAPLQGHIGEVIFSGPCETANNAWRDSAPHYNIFTHTVVRVAGVACVTDGNRSYAVGWFNP